MMASSFDSTSNLLASHTQLLGSHSSFGLPKTGWLLSRPSSHTMSRRTSGRSKTGCFSTQSFPCVGKCSCNSILKEYGNDEKPIKPTSIIFDPTSIFVHNWNKFFFVASLAAVFVDPLFIYLTVMNVKDGCMEIQNNARDFVTALRTITDIIFLFHIFLQFRTAFVAPASTILGRGELVSDSIKIAKRYLKRHFFLDFVAILPLPQVVVWVIIPFIRDSTSDHAIHAWRVILLFSYILRLRRVYLLTIKMLKTTGLVSETASSGAAYNMFLFILASHVIGACWFSLATQRHFNCWQANCESETDCKLDYLYCRSKEHKFHMARKEWLSSTNIFKNCSLEANDDRPDSFNFGIYRDAISKAITSSTNFPVKYTFSFWWGLKNLSSLGQGVINGPYIEEMVFAIALSILGLILVTLLIGNLKVYLLSITAKIEEASYRRRDTESWMHHRRLPHDLRDHIQRFEKHKWVATRGVDEESILQDLPLNLRRDIKRHLCRDLVRKVPLFNQMDDQLLDVMYELLKPSLHASDAYVIRELDPVHEMTFIVRGHLHSATTNGRQAGFYNSAYLGPGDFCGEELLNWALEQKSDEDLPTSTHTVKALADVEAFALGSEELKIVAAQFKRHNSQQLQSTFKLLSQQWRTWAALYIQAAWRRYRRRKFLLLLTEAQKDYTLRKPMVKLNSIGYKSFDLGTATGAASSPKIHKPKEPDYL